MSSGNPFAYVVDLTRRLLGSEKNEEERINRYGTATPLY